MERAAWIPKSSSPQACFVALLCLLKPTIMAMAALCCFVVILSAAFERNPKGSGWVAFSPSMVRPSKVRISLQEVGISKTSGPKLC